MRALWRILRNPLYKYAAIWTSRICEESTAGEPVNPHGSYDSIPPVGALAAQHSWTVELLHRNNAQLNMQRHSKRILVRIAVGRSYHGRSEIGYMRCQHKCPGQ